jgi:hypothetical protein
MVTTHGLMQYWGTSRIMSGGYLHSMGAIMRELGLKFCTIRRRDPKEGLEDSNYCWIGFELRAKRPLWLGSRT